MKELHGTLQQKAWHNGAACQKQESQRW